MIVVIGGRVGGDMKERMVPGEIGGNKELNTGTSNEPLRIEVIKLRSGSE